MLSSPTLSVGFNRLVKVPKHFVEDKKPSVNKGDITPKTIVYICKESILFRYVYQECRIIIR